jgi:hypothetical protein
MTGSRLGKVRRDRVHRRVLPAPGPDHRETLPDERRRRRLRRDRARWGEGGAAAGGAEWGCRERPFRQQRLNAACALNTTGSGPDDRAGHRP